MSTLLLAAALALTALPPTGLVITSVGLDDRSEALVADRVSAQLTRAGATLQRLETSTECLDDLACIQRLLAGVGATALVTVEALRVGAQVQLAARLHGPDGAVVEDVTALVAAAELEHGAALLPARFVDRLRPRGELAATPPQRVSTTGSPPPVRPIRAEGAPPPVSAALPADPGLPPLAVAGVLTAGLGLLVTAVGVGGGVTEVAVYNTPGSSGDDKALAQGLVGPLFAVGAFGLVIAAAGAVLVVMGASDARLPAGDA